MDGKGRYTYNIFVERLWRTMKYEEVYLKAYSNGREANPDRKLSTCGPSLKGHTSTPLLSRKFRSSLRSGPPSEVRTS